MPTPDDLNQQSQQNDPNGFWTQNRGLITGPFMKGLFGTIAAILAGMGVWGATGFRANDTALILGQAPAAIATSGSGADLRTGTVPNSALVTPPLQLGTTDGTAAAGNDSRIAGAVQPGGAVDTNTVGGASLSNLLSPTISLDFAKALYQAGTSPGLLSSFLTVSGDANRTYIGSDGQMRLAAPNTPRITYDLSNGARLGLLGPEPAASNLLLNSYSMQSSNGFFNNGQAALSSDLAPLLAGSGVAKHTRSNSSDDVVGYFYSNTPAANTPYVETAYVYIPSSSTATAVTLEPSGGSQTGAVGVSADLTKRDQWQRIIATTTTLSTAPTRLQPRLHLSPVGAVAYSALWQVEQGKTATSYIPSAGSVVSRNAEAISLAPAATRFYDPSQPHTFVWRGLVRNTGLNTTAEQGGFTISDPLGSNVISFQDRALALSLSTSVSGAQQASLGVGTAALQIPFEVATAVAPSDIESYQRVDGAGSSAASTATSALPTDLYQISLDPGAGFIHRTLTIIQGRVASASLPGLPDGGSLAVLSANASLPGATVPVDFLGWSLEFNSGGLGSGLLTPSNTNLVNLWRIVTGGASTGTLRLGGASQDTNSTTPYVPPTVSAATLTNLNGFLNAVWPGGWTVLYGLDYFANDTTKAVSVAGSVINALGASNVIFTIGNEPDGSARGLTFSSYLSQWQSYYNALKSAYPSIRIGAPDAANTLSDASNWTGQLASLIQANPSYAVDSLTQHYYSGAPGQSLDQFLSSNARLTNLSAFGATQASLAGASIRASEMNSIYSGGQAGISDALVSVPWLIDSLILLENAGWRSATLHGLLSGNAFYTPQTKNADGTYVLKPVGYGMMLWDMIEGGRILPLNRTAPYDIKAMSVLGADSKVRFIVCNKDPNATRQLLITQSGSWTTQQVTLVTGPSATSGTVTIGGATVPTGTPTATSIPRGTAITLPPASAAVVVLN